MTNYALDNIYIISYNFVFVIVFVFVTALGCSTRECANYCNCNRNRSFAILYQLLAFDEDGGIVGMLFEDALRVDEGMYVDVAYES